MRIGATIFATDWSWDIGELAVELEQRGFTSLWTPEHTHIPTSRETPPPVGGDLPVEYRRTLDPFVALTLAAARTTTLRVGTGIALVAQRDPIVTAKAAATLDFLSGGRFEMGVGFGWNEDELRHHGVAMTERRAVVEDRVAAMRALWRDDEAAHEGPHVSFTPSWAYPKPVQAGGPPVMIGGGAGPKLFDHLVRWADGWLPIGGSGLGEAVPRLHQQLTDAGRDPGDFRIVPFGSAPNEGMLEHFAGMGIDEVVVRLPSAGRDEVMAALDSYQGLLDN